MASPALIEFDVQTPRAFLLTDLLAEQETALRADRRSAVARHADRLSGAEVESGSCMKGFFVAIALEAALTLSLYGAWRLLHILR